MCDQNTVKRITAYQNEKKKQKPKFFLPFHSVRPKGRTSTPRNTQPARHAAQREPHAMLEQSARAGDLHR